MKTRHLQQIHKPIEFFQLTKSRKKKRIITFLRPKEIADMAHQIIQEGGMFEIEVLKDGGISMVCERNYDTLSHQICINDPSISDYVDVLVKEAYEKL